MDQATATEGLPVAIVLLLNAQIVESLFVPTVACGVAGNRSVNGAVITTRRIPVRGNQFRTSNKSFRAKLANQFVPALSAANLFESTALVWRRETQRSA